MDRRRFCQGPYPRLIPVKPDGNRFPVRGANPTHRAHELLAVRANQGLESPTMLEGRGSHSEIVWNGNGESAANHGYDRIMMNRMTQGEQQLAAQ